MTECFQRDQFKDNNPNSTQNEGKLETQRHHKAFIETAADNEEDKVDGELVIPGATQQMNNDEFWTKGIKLPEALIMDEEEIEHFNMNIIKQDIQTCDFRNYAENISKQNLTRYIEQYKMPSKDFFTDNGDKLDENFYSEVNENCDIPSLQNENQVLFGVAVRKTNLRAFPTDKGFYDTSSNYRIDRLQEASIEPCEAVAVLHCSKDKNWLFVQTSNYKAWTKAEDIALAQSKLEVLNYTEHTKFLMVTGNHVKTKVNGIKVEFAMGTRIPLADCSQITTDYLKTDGSYIINLPFRDYKGKLFFENALMSSNEDVHEGYLPYTRKNIIIQAFKLLGDPYDWGNKFGGRDCSGFAECIYKTFGFKLPRNSGDQENLPGISIAFNAEDNAEARNAKMDKLKAGALIFMKGHEMIYLGKYEGKHYVIHNFAGYGKKGDGGYEFVPVYAVAVTPADLPLSSGTPYIMNFTTAVQLDCIQ